MQAYNCIYIKLIHFAIIFRTVQTLQISKTVIINKISSEFFIIGPCLSTGAMCLARKPRNVEYAPSILHRPRLETRCIKPAPHGRNTFFFQTHSVPATVLILTLDSQYASSTSSPKTRTSKGLIRSRGAPKFDILCRFVARQRWVKTVLPHRRC